MTKPAEIGDNADAKKIIDRWIALLEEQDKFAEDLKELKIEAATKFNKKQLKAMALVVKEHRKPMDSEVKAFANTFFANSGGQYQMFGE